MLSLFATNFLDGVYPLLLKLGIDQIEQSAPLSEIGRTAGLFFALMISLALTRYGWRLGFGYFHSSAAEHIRQTIFRHLTTMGPKFFNKNPVGELMSLITNDVQSFRQAIGPGLLILADGVIIISIVLPIMISLEPSWTWKTLIFLPFVPFLIWKVLRLIYARYREQQEKFAELTGFAQENIGGIRVVKSFALEDRRSLQFDALSGAYEKACNRVARVDGLFGPVMEFGVASGSVILLFVAQEDVVAGAVSIGTFVAFHRYIQKMVWPMTALGMGLSMFQKGWTSFGRIREVLVQDTSIPDTGRTELNAIESIEFKDIHFTYPEATTPSLKNINFKVQAGECLGVMGPVGAGKTTLLSLLLRLYPQTSGEILINGRPHRDYTLESLRRNLVLIPQEPFLFSDTVAGNLSFGVLEDLPKQHLDSLLNAVDMTEEINQLPDQQNALLGERGVNLSGGQKQRLAIARGLACRSQVLILDDALSAVDTKTESRIEELLKQHPAHTRLVVAHRLSSLKSAQRILVLKNGEIEALGTPEELQTTSPTYRLISEMQNQPEAGA